MLLYEYFIKLCVDGFLFTLCFIVSHNMSRNFKINALVSLPPFSNIEGIVVPVTSVDAVVQRKMVASAEKQNFPPCVLQLNYCPEQATACVRLVCKYYLKMGHRGA
jgi:hypothetical protein